MIGIYKITNKINGKVYIGQSVNIEQRWKEHRKRPFQKNSKAYEYPLYRAIRKYGLDNFSFEVLEECKKEKLNDREIFYITRYNSCGINGYNQDEGGYIRTYCLKLTDNDIQEIVYRLQTTCDSMLQIGLDFNVGQRTIYSINSGESYYQKNVQYPIRKPHRGKNLIKQEIENKQQLKAKCPICGKQVKKQGTRCLSCYKAEKKQKSEEKHCGVGFLDLAKEIKETSIEAVGCKYGVSGKTITCWFKKAGLPYHRKEIIKWYNQQLNIVEQTYIQPKEKPRSRPVYQISQDTKEILNIFKSQAEAMKYLGIKSHDGHITQVCKGIRKTAYGYIWKYADE